MKSNMRMTLATFCCAFAYSANASSFMGGYKIDVLKDVSGHLVLSNDHFETDAPSINNRGNISGNSGSGNFGGAFFATQVSGGSWNFISLPNMKPNGAYNKVFAMNDNDQMVGYSTSIGDRRNAVLWSKDASGTYVASSLHQGPADAESFAYDINNSGHVVGTWAKGFDHAMLASGFVPSNPTVANASSGYVISDTGIYAGAAQGYYPGFASDNQTKVNVGNNSRVAEDINDKGLGKR